MLDSINFKGMKFLKEIANIYCVEMKGREGGTGSCCGGQIYLLGKVQSTILERIQNW